MQLFLDTVIVGRKLLENYRLKYRIITNNGLEICLLYSLLYLFYYSYNVWKGYTKHTRNCLVEYYI